MSAWRRTLQYLMAIVLVVATYDLDRRLSTDLANQPNVILYLPAIIVGSYFGGLGPGLLATAVALLTTHSLLIDFGAARLNPDPADQVHWALLLLSGLLITLLNVYTRRMERRLAQAEALEESEARFRAIVQDQTELISRLDRKGRLTYVNQAYAQFFGRKPEELIGQRWSPLATPADLERVETELDHLSFNRPVVSLEYRVADARGRQRWMQFVYRALFDDEGHRRDTQVIGRDITELHDTLQALDESSQRLRILVEESQDGIVLLDRNGRLRECNSGFAYNLGYERDEVHNLYVWDWDAQWTREELLAMLKNPAVAPRHFETLHRRRDGTTFAVEISFTPFEFKGEPMAFAVVRDISERKMLENALRESETRYRSVVTAMNEGLCVQDGKGHITASNPAAVRILGRSTEQLLNHTSDNLDWNAIRADGSPFPGQEYPAKLALRDGQAQNGVVMGIHRPDGELCWLSINAQPLIAVGELRPFAVVTTFRDITPDVAAEAKLRLAASVFDEAQEGIIITDEQARIVDVNPAFTTITGFRREEVLGRNPSILSSGRHEHEFYVAMWQELTHSGHWQGEIWNRYKDGQMHAENLTIGAVRDEHGRTVRYIALFSEITSRKLEQEALAHRAFHDPLTGLPNRALLDDRLGVALASAERNGKQLALCYLDLDYFKPVNDQYGHEVGDLLLVELAQRLIASTRAQDTVSRLGGDEFVLLLNELGGADEALTILQRVLATVAEPFLLGQQRSALVSASIGVTFYPGDGDSAGQLLMNADQAMYRAKLSGRNRICSFDPLQDARRPDMTVLSG